MPSHLSSPMPPATTAERQTEPPRVRSRDLLRGSRSILIEHGADRYCLRMTRNNKLILTK